jgi:hypothetical protein
MNNEPPKKSIKDSVLHIIKQGEVKMRPKWHFILNGILLGVGTALVVFTLLYLASFILFILRQNGIWFLPSFGFRGLGLLFFSLPWILILTAVIFIFILELLVRQYSFAYRRPLFYSALGVILLVVIGGFVIAQTDLHPGFYRTAREGHLPFAGKFYRDFGMGSPDNVCPCQVKEITENGFKATDPHDQEVTVVITPETKFPLGTNFAAGDEVLVIGDRKDEVIMAEGIRKIDDTFFVRPQMQESTTSQFRIFFKKVK